MTEPAGQLEPGIYIAGRDEDGVLMIMALRDGGDAGRLLGAALIDLGGRGVVEVAHGSGVEARWLERIVLAPFSRAEMALSSVAEEAAIARLAVAERVTRRRNHRLPEGFDKVLELFSSHARQVRSRTLRQLEEEEALSALPPAVLRRVLRDRLANLYGEWVDEAIPALEGLTPRLAWQDPVLRAKVEEVLERVARVEDIRLKGIGVAFDAERLRQRLDQAESEQGATYQEVETEISDVLLLAQVPPEERLNVYRTWWGFVEQEAPQIRNPRPWAAALYWVMARKIRLVPLSWDELEKLFDVDRGYGRKLAKRIDEVIS